MTPLLPSEPSPARVLLCAGGTGGHLFPAVALAETLTLRGVEVSLMTDARGQSYVPHYLFKAVYVIPSGYWQGSFLQKWYSFGRLLLAFVKAFRMMKRLSPRVVWGLGGAASFIPLLLALLLRIPCGIYQLDAVLGRANRWLLPFVQKIATGFQQTKDLPSTAKTIWVSLPVRGLIQPLPYTPPPSSGPFHLLILGGSQGAQIFSTLLPQAIALLDVSWQKRIWIRQQCRSNLLNDTRRAYRETKAHVTLSAFIEDMGGALQDAHLVITRAGASTIGELACTGRPALFIPYPFAAHDHQTENARLVVEREGGWMFAQKELTPQKLAAFLEEVLSAPDSLLQRSIHIRDFYQADGLAQIADIMIEWIQKSSS